MKDVDKHLIKEAISKATVEFTHQIIPLGFQRTKKWFWVREQETSADFVHIHVNSSSYCGSINYSVSFRVHCGFRDYNDTFEALALNGPNSDAPEFREKRYHMRFNAKSGSTYERCIQDLVRFVKSEGEPWFGTQSKGNGLGDDTRTQNEVASRKLLGLKRSRV